MSSRSSEFHFPLPNDFACFRRRMMLRVLSGPAESTRFMDIDLYKLCFINLLTSLVIPLAHLYDLFCSSLKHRKTCRISLTSVRSIYTYYTDRSFRISLLNIQKLHAQVDAFSLGVALQAACFMTSALW